MFSAERNGVEQTQETVVKFVILGMASRHTKGSDGGLFNDGGRSAFQSQE